MVQYTSILCNIKFRIPKDYHELQYTDFMNARLVGIVCYTYLKGL